MQQTLEVTSCAAELCVNPTNLSVQWTLPLLILFFVFLSSLFWSGSQPSTANRLLTFWLFDCLLLNSSCSSFLQLSKAMQVSWIGAHKALCHCSSLTTCNLRLLITWTLENIVRLWHEVRSCVFTVFYKTGCLGSMSLKWGQWDWPRYLYVLFVSVVLVKLLISFQLDVNTRYKFRDSGFWVLGFGVSCAQCDPFIFL